MTEQPKILDMAGNELELAEDPDEQPIPEKATEICHLIANGMPLRKACDVVHIGTDRWYRWLRDFPTLETQYNQAATERAAELAYEGLALVDAADGTSSSQVQKAKIQAEQRRWWAAKLDPKRYGDYQRTEMTVTDAGNVAGAAQDMLRLRKRRDRTATPADTSVTETEAGAAADGARAS